MEKHKFTGKTREEAIQQAVENLQELEENLIILDGEEQKGGLFKSKKVEIIAIEKREVTKYIKEFLIELLKKLGFKANVEVKTKEGTPNYTIYSDNDSLLIGKNGRTLSSIQNILRGAIAKETGMHVNVILDVENYKQKQQKNIERLAIKLAKEVRKTKEPITMDSMNSYERRLVHAVLSDFKGVITESEGEEPNRKVVIKPEK
jgi:spoIIIJ-associated protein